MPAESFDDVLVVNPSQVRPVAPAEVAQAELDLGVRLPSGYADYVQRLGAGALGHFVRVHVPGKLPALTREWRERVSEYWFWDTAEAGVAPEALQERGVLVADSFDGDELCCDPAEPDALFVLPRSEDVAHRVDGGLLAALDWMLSGALNPWTEGWTFEAWTDRAEVMRSFPAGPGLAEATRAVAGLGLHSHLVDLGERKTFFLPDTGARLSLYQLAGEDLAMDLTCDQDSGPEVVDRFVSMLERG